MSYSQAPIGSIFYSSNQTVGTYPFVNVKQTESGHIFLMDDTLNQEQIILQHGKTGTHIQMMPNGDYEHRVYGNNFSIVVNDQNVVIQGVCNIEVHGDSKMHVYGDSNIQIDGSLYATAGKDSYVQVSGDLDVSSTGSVTVSAGSATNPVGSDITLISGGGVNIKGDLTVSGQIAAGAISSNAGITATTKVFAAGGLETLGGLNVGFTTPGPLVPTGVTTSTISQTAPLHNSTVALTGVTSDVFGPLAIWRLFSGTHNHIAPSGGGPTTPPPNGASVV